MLFRVQLLKDIFCQLVPITKHKKNEARTHNIVYNTFGG